MENEKYEGKFFYRIIKVAYYLFLLILVGLSFAQGWDSRPRQLVQDSKSSISCTNGKIYKFEGSGVFLYEKGDEPSYSDDLDLRKLCAYGVTNDYSATYNKLQTPELKNYTLNLSYKDDGSWLSVAGWSIIGSLISYAVLNIIRETLNYMFLGKKFDWEWLINFVALLNS